jgi:hypothetical protein
MNMQGDMAKHYGVIKQDLINTGIVDNVALSDHSTIYGGNNTDNLTWQGKSPGKVLVSWRDVTPEFFPTSGMRIHEGRNFEMADSVNFDKPGIRANVIITQSLAKMLGKGSALGKIISDQSDTAVFATVVGVVNDYVYGNMYGKPDPVVFFCIAPRFASVMYVHIKPETNPELVLAKMETVMKKDNPAYPFDTVCGRPV